MHEYNPAPLQKRRLLLEVRPLVARAGPAMVAGALAGFFLVELGLPQIGGNLSPPLIVVTSAALGAVLGALRLETTVFVVDLFLATLFLVIAVTPLMYYLAGGWVRNDPADSSVSAVVVLSSDVNSEGRINDTAVERLLTGVALVRRGLAPRLFTTAVDHAFGSTVQTSVADQRRLVALGGVESSWMSIGHVRNTHDEALRTLAHLPAGARTVAVVTSPMHTRRACATFEAVGVRVVCVAAEERGEVTWRPVTSDDRLASFRQYLYERLGMVKYASQGWLPRAR